MTKSILILETPILPKKPLAKARAASPILTIRPSTNRHYICYHIRYCFQKFGQKQEKAKAYLVRFVILVVEYKPALSLAFVFAVLKGTIDNHGEVTVTHALSLEFIDFAFLYEDNAFFIVLEREVL